MGLLEQNTNKQGCLFYMIKVSGYHKMLASAHFFICLALVLLINLVGELEVCDITVRFVKTAKPIK